MGSVAILQPNRSANHGCQAEYWKGREAAGAFAERRAQPISGNAAAYALLMQAWRVRGGRVREGYERLAGAVLAQYAVMHSASRHTCRLHRHGWCHCYWRRFTKYLFALCFVIPATASLRRHGG